MPRLAVLAASVLVLLLSACSAGDGDDEPAPPPPSAATGAIPELEREWVITSYATIPQTWNEHYWLTDFSYYPGDAGGVRRIGTGLKMFEARTGDRIRLDLDGHACGVPALRPGDTHVVVTTSAEPADTYYSKAEHQSGIRPPERACHGLAVYDATTGSKAWEWPLGSKGPFRYLGSSFGAVMVTYPNGRAGCFDLADGRRLSVSTHEKCVTGDPYLPPFLDEHGAPLKRLEDQREIARLDGVLLVSGRLPTGPALVRAHDLGTGKTLWADEVDPDPSEYQAWNRSETYAGSPDSLLRIRYEFEQDEDAPEQLVPTFAIISRVDPRTGKELEQVGRIEQGLFLAQVGDIAVMGVDQELGLRAHLVGFRIPPADGG